MTKRILIALLSIAIISVSCKKDDGNGPVVIPSTHPETEQPEQKPATDDTYTVVKGKVLPPWQEGYLDIHSINSGRGESFFYIFPDGTTMLIDAAGSLLKDDPKPPTPPKPNGDITSGQVITDYIKHYLPEVSGGTINYLMVSHFHSDHMGSYSSTLPYHSSGKFRKTGITEVGGNIPFDVIFDRGKADNLPSSDMTSTSAMNNYYNFINWAKTAYGATDERFIAGRNDQIVLKHDASKYTSFEVRNLAANGYVWTGSGTLSRTDMPDLSDLQAWKKSSSDDARLPYENILSCALHLRYGMFDWFCGGDIQYNGRNTYPYKDIEAPIAKVMGHVEVMKACHHGTANTNSQTLLNALTPDAMIVGVWRNVQPNYDTMGRVYKASSDCQIFTTNMTDDNKVTLADYMNRFRETSGHIVVRVQPGGRVYSIYTLDDNDQEYKVKGIFGPYSCK